MKIVKQLYLKFSIIPLIIVASLLAITFGTIYAIAYNTTNKEITSSVKEASAAASTHPLNSKYVYIVEKLDDKSNVLSTSTYFFDSYSFSESQINDIKENIKNGKNKFSSNNHRFISKEKTITDNENKYIVYTLLDYTEKYESLLNLGLSLLSVFIVSLFVISILSYILAYITTKPINDAFEKERDLIANASHELKTPLTVARTNLELVCQDPNLTVAENMKWIEGARYQIDRMNSLILQMLELSKMEQDNFKLNAVELDLSSLIEGILLSFEAGCYENNIRFVSSIQPNIDYKCDKVETEKLITILVDNAIKYTTQGGEVSVVMAKTLKNISIKVTNTGHGIPPEKIEKIFDRFYKLDASHKESGNSFGLGLSIAKLIATSMNGDIKCYSEVDRYTTFEVLLPIR